jgi:hypothetical protein
LPLSSILILWRSAQNCQVILLLLLLPILAFVFHFVILFALC